MYIGEIASKVMRYSNGEVTEAPLYHWYREETNAPGYLYRLDSSANFILDPSTASHHIAQQYKTFAVFACNPLLPLMVTDADPLQYQTSWELLRIFHPRHARGLSQVVTLESPIGPGGAPVRYVAGRSPSWMPALIPRTYRTAYPRPPESSGLGGELGIILGLMALTADHSPHDNEAVNEAFLLRRQWRRNEWRGGDLPRGCK